MSTGFRSVMKASGKNAVLRDLTLRVFGKPNKKVDLYYMGLGKFVTSYAFVERDVQTLLWRLAKLEAPISQAVLSGVRTEAAVALIHRIADAERWPQQKKAAYKNCLDQLHVLNKLRNDLLHRGSELQPDGTWLITNQPFVHVPERTTNLTMTVTKLDQAYRDIVRVRLIFSLILDSVQRSEEWWRSHKMQSWSYKPAPQGRKAQANRRKQPA